MDLEYWKFKKSNSTLVEFCQNPARGAKFWCQEGQPSHWSTETALIILVKSRNHAKPQLKPSVDFLTDSVTCVKRIFSVTSEAAHDARHRLRGDHHYWQVPGGHHRGLWGRSQHLPVWGNWRQRRGLLQLWRYFGNCNIRRCNELCNSRNNNSAVLKFMTAINNLVTRSTQNLSQCSTVIQNSLLLMRAM